MKRRALVAGEDQVDDFFPSDNSVSSGCTSLRASSSLSESSSSEDVAAEGAAPDSHFFNLPIAVEKHFLRLAERAEARLKRARASIASGNSCPAFSTSKGSTNTSTLIQTIHTNQKACDESRIRRYREREAVLRLRNIWCPLYIRNASIAGCPSWRYRLGTILLRASGAEFYIEQSTVTTSRADFLAAEGFCSVPSQTHVGYAIHTTLLQNILSFFRHGNTRLSLEELENAITWSRERTPGERGAYISRAMVPMLLPPLETFRCFLSHLLRIVIWPVYHVRLQELRQLSSDVLIMDGTFKGSRALMRKKKREHCLFLTMSAFRGEPLGWSASRGETSICYFYHSFLLMCDKAKHLKISGSVTKDQIIEWVLECRTVAILKDGFPATRALQVR